MSYVVAFASVIGAAWVLLAGDANGTGIACLMQVLPKPLPPLTLIAIERTLSLRYHHLPLHLVIRQPEEGETVYHCPQW